MINLADFLEAELPPNVQIRIEVNTIVTEAARPEDGEGGTSMTSEERVPINTETGQPETPATIYEGDQIRLEWDDRFQATALIIERSGSSKEAYTFCGVQCRPYGIG